MAFWRAETLLQRLPRLIDPFDPTAIDCAAYTLHMGKEIYISPDGTKASPNRHTKEELSTGEGFAIPPGQFAFLLTEETVTVPHNALAFISIKAGIKFNGLINISGFHADPGYSGRLLFSVLNAGPKPLHLRQGQKLFLIWYADLDGTTAYKKSRGEGLSYIEPRLINNISGEILSLQSLSTSQRKLGDRIDKLEARGMFRQNMRIALFAAFIGGLMAIAGPYLVTWLSHSFAGEHSATTSGEVLRVDSDSDTTTLSGDSELSE
ncbi:MAG: deoxycytidine triphosphate deaminase [Candidatus Tectomicrobia bacterium]|nr:deoxycytidine triphosphate deaminase [Candidatus Tectomicrobia bacterium]